MSLAGDKVISDYKNKLRSELKLNKELFKKKMEEYLEKDVNKSKYFSEPTQDLLYSGISTDGLKLIGIEDKNTYSQHFLEVNYPKIYNEENRVPSPTKGGRKTKSKKSNRRNTRKHRKSRKSRKSRK